MQIGLRKSGNKYYLAVFKYVRTGCGKDAKISSKYVRNIGPLSKFDDGKPDYLNRLRESFRMGNCIIPEIQDLAQEQSKSVILKTEYDIKKPEDMKSETKNIGYVVLNTIYDSIGFDQTFVNQKHRFGIKYDILGLFKLLIFERILTPASKNATFKNRKRYFFSDVTTSNRISEMYQSLDIIAKKSLTLQIRLNNVIEKSTISRDKEICFYDVTNYYFETDKADEDILDQNGNIIKEGLRKRGYSKEHRNEPIVQMGLFIDNNGIPISFKTFSGNTIDQKTMRPLLNIQRNKLGYKKTIVVADAGINSNFNLANLVENGDGYVVAKSLGASDKETTEWILDESNYIFNVDNTIKTKSMIRERVVENENKTKVVLKEKVVAVWTKSFYEREKQSLDEKIEKLKGNLQKPSAIKKRTNFDKYLNTVVLNKEDGEIIDSRTIYTLNEDEIKEAYKELGYRTILTSEIDNSDRDILHKYHELSRIEDSFRVLKSDLNARPVFVWTEAHIEAHFTICFIALSILRILQYKILRYLGKSTTFDECWESGMSVDRIKAALNDWNLNLTKDILTLNETDLRDDIDLILKAIGSDLYPEESTYSGYNKLRLKMKKNFVL
jgi:transposase